MMKSNPLVSIVLRTWDCFELLKIAIETLIENTQDIDYELIVVSDDNDPEIISFLLKLDATLILNKKKIGSCEATSKGTKIASGKYVAIVDNDILFSAGWLSGVIQELQDNNAHLIAPNRFRDLVHPNTLKPLRKEWQAIKDLDEKWYDRPLQSFLSFSQGKDINEFAREVLSVSSPQLRELMCPPEFVNASGMIYDREFVEKIGGAIDPIFHLYGGDDVDLCWRIGTSGGKILRSAKTYIHHFEHGSVLKGNIDYQKLTKHNNEVLFHRWHSILHKFIKTEIAKGESIDTLAKRYMLIRKYLDLYPETKI